MATIYQKTVSDKTVILAPREMEVRPFDVGLWTELRLGMYISGVASSGDNTDSAAESVTLSSAADRIAFGIKDTATNDLPGFGAALFLGAVTETASTSTSSATKFDSGNNDRVSAAGYHDTTLVGGAFAQTLGPLLNFPSAAGATGYCGFACLKFVITNRGAATQSVAISAANTTPIAGTDYSATALRLLMNGATFGTPVSIAWNTGAAARTIPDAAYVRMPFYSNRLRVSAMRGIRYAP